MRKINQLKNGGTCAVNVNYFPVYKTSRLIDLDLPFQY